MTRTSTIKDLTLKTGSTGTLCFVSVDHVISTPRGVAVRERHDIVYREMPADGQNATPAKPPAAPAALSIPNGISPIRCCCFVIRR